MCIYIYIYTYIFLKSKDGKFSRDELVFCSHCHGRSEAGYLEAPETVPKSGSATGVSLSPWLSGVGFKV